MVRQFDGFRLVREPVLQFDESDASKIHESALLGLRQYGSYTQDTSPIRIGILSPARYKASVEALLRTLNAGHRTMVGGSRKWFHCDFALASSEALEDFSVTNIERACNSL